MCFFGPIHELQFSRIECLLHITDCRSAPDSPNHKPRPSTSAPAGHSAPGPHLNCGIPVRKRRRGRRARAARRKPSVKQTPQLLARRVSGVWGKGGAVWARAVPARQLGLGYRCRRRPLMYGLEKREGAPPRFCGAPRRRAQLAATPGRCFTFTRALSSPIQHPAAAPSSLHATAGSPPLPPLSPLLRAVKPHSARIGPRLPKSNGQAVPKAPAGSTPG